MTGFNRFTGVRPLLVLAALILASIGQRAEAINNLSPLSISKTDLTYYLSNPRYATFAKYDAKDSAGNAMHSPSVLQVAGQAYMYVAVYHSPYAVSGGTRYKINLAGSNDLRNWTFIRTLDSNGSMPKIAQVSGASWLVLTHESWQGAGPTSAAPAQVAFRLFYDAADLLSGTIRSTWLQPSFVTGLNGTPSFYELHLANYGGWYCVDGQYGFHYWDGTRDRNANTTILKLFHPITATATYPSDAGNYNNLFISNGVTGNIGQRDTVLTTSGRFNVQEGNLGVAGGSWDLWRIWLYEFGDALNYPTGTGTVTMLSPATAGGSTSIGNPSVSVVDSPSGVGKSLVVSYFLFGEGAAPGEAGSLLYYFDIP